MNDRPDCDNISGRRAQAPRRRRRSRSTAAAARVLARLGALPRQKPPLWRCPAVLLDWEFAPAWPRMAALAGCAAIGFVIGIAGSTALDPSNAPDSCRSDGADLGSIVFGPEH